jgi:hypothetical protein
LVCEDELRAVVAVVETLPANLLVPPVDTSRDDVDIDWSSVRVVRDVVLGNISMSCIDGSLWQLALDTASSIRATPTRNEQLREVACHPECPKEICAAAVVQICRVADSAERIRAMFGLATFMAKDDVERWLERILAEPPSEERAAGILLSWIDSISSDEANVGIEAEAILRRMLDGLELAWFGDRERTRLGDQLTLRMIKVDDVPRALALIDSLHSESDREQALLQLVTRCPISMLAEVETRVRSLESAARVTASMVVLGRVPSRQRLTEFLAALAQRRYHPERDELLATLAELTPPPDWDEGLAKIFESVLSSEEVFAVALGWAATSGTAAHSRHRQSANALTRMLETDGLPLSELDRAAIATRIEFLNRTRTSVEATRERVVASAHLPADAREVALERILEAVRLIPEPDVRARTMVELAGSFPAGQRRHALAEARWLIDGLDPRHDRSDLLLLASRRVGALEPGGHLARGSSLGFVAGRSHWTRLHWEDAGRQLRRVVCVAHGRVDVGVPELARDHRQRHAGRHGMGGERVPLMRSSA